MPSPEPIREPDARPLHRPHVAPVDERGHCLTCNAGWREYTECKSWDCCFVRDR